MTETKAEAKSSAGTNPATSTGRNTNYLLMLSYSSILALWGASQVVAIPYVAHLLALVTAILYAACHASLVLREEPVAMDGSEHSRPSSEREILRKEDAYQFPLVGSVSLFSLYLAFKFLDKDLVNLLIGAYFAVVGCIALTMTIAPLVERVTPAFFRRSVGWDYKLKHPLPEIIAGPSPWDLGLEITGAEIVAFLAAAVVCGLYLQSKPWYLNNVLGISFCLQGIERFSLGTYKIGAILLIGLFFYDIFWVFGTDVMVTVAKNLDGPIKILFPRSLEVNPATGKLDLSLLGLGDIVIPGFFLAILLRFDAHQAKVPVNVPTDFHASFPKPYFHSALLAYVAGLGVTMFVMIQFNAAQPALLYLVPACLGSSFLCALVRGEVKELLDYSEEEEEEDVSSESEVDRKDK
jgi:minor histocompatibility antigen H13